MRGEDDFGTLFDGITNGRQGAENPAVGLDERDLDIFFGLDLIETKQHQSAHRAVQLRRQFRARCAGADDRDVELPRAH